MVLGATHRTIISSLVFVALLLVIGCANVKPTPSPTPSAEPQTFARTIAPTETNVPTATHTLTPTPTSTSTPTPTFTRTSTPTITRTFTPTITRTPTATPLPKGPVTRIDTKFRSGLLKQDRRIIIYLPPGYNDSPQRRYPVLYLLHGYGGCGAPVPEWEEWGLKSQLEKMIVANNIQPMLAVLPDGFMPDCQPSYFFNHQPGMTDGLPWGDNIWGEVVSYIDQNYRTLARRESRAIGGFSLGGQGALTLALMHPEIFAIVGAHSPSFRGADGTISFINDWNWYNQYDPIWLTQNTETARQLSLWIDVGADDDKVRHCGPGSDRCVEAYHALLLARNLPHEWHGDWAGKHEGPTYWGPHIPDYLTWYSAQLRGQ